MYYYVQIDCSFVKGFAKSNVLRESFAYDIVTVVARSGANIYIRYVKAAVIAGLTRNLIFHIKGEKLWNQKFVKVAPVP